mmetsp:Transcript_115237/g.366314  ORF Transcript_115237/g.366314 Transcript_115237/m.366314 type:complete len:211 (-) Transcript_115237:2148-2780(-)
MQTRWKSGLQRNPAPMPSRPAPPTKPRRSPGRIGHGRRTFGTERVAARRQPPSHRTWVCPRCPPRQLPWAEAAAAPEPARGQSRPAGMPCKRRPFGRPQTSRGPRISRRHQHCPSARYLWVHRPWRRERRSRGQTRASRPTTASNASTVRPTSAVHPRLQRKRSGEAREELRSGTVLPRPRWISPLRPRTMRSIRPRRPSSARRPTSRVR